MKHFGFTALILAIVSVPRTALAGFTNVTVSAGVSYRQNSTSIPLDEPMTTIMAGGAAARDYDGDGWVDLYVTRFDKRDILFRNLGTDVGGVHLGFSDVTTSAFQGTNLINAQTNGAAWGDVDNDGDADLYVTGNGENRHFLYLNNGDGTFAEDAVSRGISLIETPELKYGTSPALGDYDRDGYLDVYAAEWRLNSEPVSTETGIPHSRLFRNQGAAAPGHFVDRTEAAGVIPSTTLTGVSKTFTPRWSDFDRDGNTDLFVAADFGTSKIYWNKGDGTFEEGTEIAGVGTGDTDMGATVGDYDGDGLLDIFITDIYDNVTSPPNIINDGNRLFRNNGDRTFTDETDARDVRIGQWGWGTSWIEADNDGDLDLVMTNGMNRPSQFSFIHESFTYDPIRFWRNDGEGQFTQRATQEGLIDTGTGKGLLVFDYDRDGDQDVFIVNSLGQPVLYRNDESSDNDWLRIDVEGSTWAQDGLGPKTNRDGVGTVVTLIKDTSQPTDIQVREISASSNYLAQNEPTVHFGLGNLGENATIDRVEVLYPSGELIVLENVPVNKHLLVSEIPGDYNGNGQVEGGDFLAWQREYGLATIQPGAGADGDMSGTVDYLDLSIWKVGFRAGEIQPFSVPEPSTLVISQLVLVLLAGMWRERWKSSNSSPSRNSVRHCIVSGRSAYLRCLVGGTVYDTYA